MKTLKTGIVLLALLLAVMTLIPMVCAGESRSDSVVTDKEVQEIFDTASVSETLPTTLSPEEEIAYLEGYVSPARRAIDLMKTRKYTDDQITEMLHRNGYGWDPSTRACWKGRDPTPEEQKVIDKIRGPGYSPFPEDTDKGRKSEKNVLSWRGAGATMNLRDENTYFGIYYEMRPGDMVISSSGTTEHVVTAHVGKRKPGGQEDWTEAGVSRSIDDPREYFTFDNDEGEWEFHGSAGSSTYKTYKIYVTSTHESEGYLYHTWVGGSWVRDGHLYYRQTKYNCANEIWADGTNPFSVDTIKSVFRNEYLYKSSGYQYWGDYTATRTDFYPDDPPYESHSMSGNAWKFTTWT